jgi:hypothetical protein
MQSPTTLGRPLATGPFAAAISRNWSGPPPGIAQELERSSHRPPPRRNALAPPDTPRARARRRTAP